MNKIRRKQVYEAITAVNKIVELIQNILDDEQESFDNMPESLQLSENGIVSEEAQESLDAAIISLEEAISYLEEI
jgi:hypothetical protein